MHAQSRAVTCPQPRCKPCGKKREELRVPVPCLLLLAMRPQGNGQAFYSIHRTLNCHGFSSQMNENLSRKKYEVLFLLTPLLLKKRLGLCDCFCLQQGE